MFIGLMSGTSMDGIDAVLANFDDGVELVAMAKRDYPDEVREQLLAIRSNPASCGIDTIGHLDTAIGACFRDAVNALLKAANVDKDKVTAIGSHGQTIRHRPDSDYPFTMQIGNPAVIAAGTGIDTVADFRSIDMALGGHAAPLLPPFHAWLFRNTKTNRVILNIGGIASITVLPADDGPVTGFDTGPGNTLLDAWIRWHKDVDLDDSGAWASSGNLDEELLDRLSADPWFSAAPPKSTGFEHFNLNWLSSCDSGDLEPADVQATLSELTAKTIADAVNDHAPDTDEVLVCGGGAHNPDLVARIAARLPDARIGSTADAGVEPDWIEATAFAWLAMRRLNDQPGNLPGVTGASATAVLGAVYRAPDSV